MIDVKIDGCLIQNQNGSYLLSNGKVWYSHKDYRDAYVHPTDRVKEILRGSTNWELKPTTLTKATYEQENNAVTLISDPYDIQKQSIDDVIMWLEGK